MRKATPLSDGHIEMQPSCALEPPQGASTISLNESFEAARTIMQTQAVSFYQAFMRLPEERFKAVCAVYAFCRYADDIVDETGQAALPELQDLRAAIRSLFASQPEGSCTPTAPECITRQLWWPAFVASIHQYGIEERGLLMQLQGQSMDANFHDIVSTDALVTYARLVAGSVGIILAPILVNDAASVKNPDFLQACEELGIAMQITNILRDVGEDMRERNRLYLPLNLLREHGITRDNIAALAHANPHDHLDISQGFIAVWEELAQLADNYYRSYESWITSFHPSARTSLITAAKLYQAIEQAVRKKQYNCFTQRCYTSKSTRIRIVAEVQLREKALWKIS